MKAKNVTLAGIAALLFACQILQGQGQVNFGIKAGLNIETQSELGQLWDNDVLQPGFLFGGTVEYYLTKSISLQTELNFQQKGYRSESVIGGVSSEIKRKYNYLNVPLLLKADLSDKMEMAGGWNIFAFAGPCYGYLISGDYIVKTGGNTSDTDITAGSVKNDWGVVFGGGVSHTLSNGGAVFSELRYDMGLFSIDNDDSDLRNKAISICLGYKF